MAKIFYEPVDYNLLKQYTSRRQPISEYGLENKDILGYTYQKVIPGGFDTVFSNLMSDSQSGKLKFADKFIYSFPYYFKTSPNVKIGQEGYDDKEWYVYNRVYEYYGGKNEFDNRTYEILHYYKLTDYAKANGWEFVKIEEANVKYITYLGEEVTLYSPISELYNEEYFQETFIDTNVLEITDENNYEVITYRNLKNNYFYAEYILYTVYCIIANNFNDKSNIYPVLDPVTFDSRNYQIPDIVPESMEQEVYQMGDIKLLEPIIFGNYDLTGQRNCIYEGDASTGAKFYIKAKGTIKNLIIWDADVKEDGTRDFFKIDTSKFGSNIGTDEGSIISGDEIIINTTKGEKSAVLIREGKEHNIISYISKDSAWFLLNKGNNYFFAEAESGVEYLQMSIKYNDLYEGV